MSEHLISLEEALISTGIPETYRGQPWTDNCREWVYFECRLDMERIKTEFALGPQVVVHRNDDSRSGLEMGFYCTETKDAIMGIHPDVKGDYPEFPG